jgi:formate dehydrogenase subunit beta
MKTILTVESGDLLKTLQGLLRRLLESGAVDALLVPMCTPFGAVSPTLVADSALLDEADPLAPVMPVNSATLAGQLSVREPRARVGVVLRSCELRALVELVKLQQASLESLMLVSLDCPGTYSVPVYRKLAGNGSAGGPLWRELYMKARTMPGTSNPELRKACQICEYPVFDNADIVIELLESDLDHEVHLSIREELAARMGLEPVQEADRSQVLTQLVEARKAFRDEEFNAIRLRLEGEQGIAGAFAECVRCHNCMTVCPICYCKTCVFKSQVFDHQPMQYLQWARQKGAYRMPSDTLLFHLTRLNHMVLSCVGCGMCTEACPAELPVGTVFRAVGQRLQTTFEYTPGLDSGASLPLVTFKADEWTEVGE